ncbi:hypothetical protein [Spirosoma rhododendri]|uniref:Uncharacterized protein n=1 Tax=Spirosoma rhododendri TaxID=2728024 RepID=A0A7L5DP77_9BACT|nr:hypothetical protein [Spirosoma rhododendri]QJD79372.1 hypothetical protein HH216_13840 [Spirosoma rhododendri]
MKLNLPFYLILIISALGLVGYLACLSDWITDYRGGYYKTHRLEAWLESGFIILYTSLGIRFGMRKVNMRF